MKKVLLFASALTMGVAAMAQMNTELYKVAGSPLPIALNDTANKYYQVTSLDTKKVSALSIVDSAAISSKKLWWPEAQFKIKAVDNAWVVDFDRVGGTTGANYSDFNYVWTSWVNTKPIDKPTNPFPYKKPTGTAAAPVFTKATTQDTMRGYLVDMSENPVVTMLVKSTKKTNIRVDLIDKNRRVANTLAPHRFLAAQDKFIVLEFRWDKKKADGTTVDWKFEDADNDEFNVGCAVDGWAGDWWGIDFGRGTAGAPFLNGKNAWDGAIMLDLSSIAGIAIHVEDGTITKDHNLDTAKTITIKDIVVGSAEKAVRLDSNAIKPRYDYKNAVEVSGELVSLGEDKTKPELSVYPTIGTVFNVEEEAELISVETGVVVKSSVEGVINAAGVSAGVYAVKTKSGKSALVIVK